MGMSVSHNLGFLPKSVHTQPSRVGHQDYILLYTRRQVLSTTDTPVCGTHTAILLPTQALAKTQSQRLEDCQQNKAE